MATTDDSTFLADDALVASARAGELDAFNRLVERYERLVFGVCYRLLHDPHQAEDVTQDTFIKAYLAIADYRGGSFRSWLLHIATNRAYDVLRYQRRHAATSLDAEPVEREADWAVEPAPDDPHDTADRHELQARLEAALVRIPEDQRLAVVLHDVYGYHYEEIAEITEVAVGTVRSRLSRGRARLRQILQEDPGARELFDKAGRPSASGDAAGLEG